MTQGFDLDEIERLLDEGLCDPENVCEEGFDITAGIIDQVPAMIAAIRELRATVATLGDSARAGANVLDAKDAEIRELRAENARLREDVRRQTSLAQDHFRNATRLAARAALGEPQ